MVTLTVEEFGKLQGGGVVYRYTWTTTSGFSVSAISYGAIVQSIKVPDRNGIVNDVVLGFDDLDSYVKRNVRYFGAAIGRCANRIGGGSFEVDGRTYSISKNKGTYHLHGGVVGFDKVNWNTHVDGTKVTFSYLSVDGEEGYPGDLVTNITYDVSEDQTFRVEYTATTTKKTVVNLTNHSYFNLAGHDQGADELYNHVVAINANKITETNSELIPTGQLLNVGGTPFDLRAPIRLGDVQKKHNDLFDDNFCIANFVNKCLNFVARVSHPPSGRYLEVYSNQPGVQFYTSNFLPSPSDAAIEGKQGAGYRRHGAFCLETQVYPDAVHHVNFPKSWLSPGEVYQHEVQFKFGLDPSDGVRVIAA